MLSAALLTDEGRHNLNKKMKELIEMLKNNPTTIMEINSEDKNSQSQKELLSDERLLSNTLNSMKLHAKAKLIIFTRLDEIERQKAKMGQAANGVRDFHDIEVDFSDIQDQIF